MVKERRIETDLTAGVFAGENAVELYRNPENHPQTPLLELTHPDLNPFAHLGVRIFAKDLRLPPLGQVKSGTAFNLLHASELPDDITLFEASSGNTVAALGLLADQEVTAYVSLGTPEEKTGFQRLLGVEVVETVDGIQKARAKGNEEGNANLDQYQNPANPEFFQRVIGPQIWNQTNGTITLFCTGLGTTGTMIGISRYLKGENPNIRTVGVIVKEGDSVPGVRTQKRLEEVSQPWQDAIDASQIVDEYDSYEKSLELIRKASILAGPSSGFALQGLHQEIRRLEQEGKLDSIRNENGEIVAVFPILDDPRLYVKRYFELLPEFLFKPVRKE